VLNRQVYWPMIEHLGEQRAMEDTIQTLIFADAPLAARLLTEAYCCGEVHAGSIDWDDLDQAYQAALRASGAGVDQKSIKSAKQCT